MVLHLNQSAILILLVIFLESTHTNIANSISCNTVTNQRLTQATQVHAPDLKQKIPNDLKKPPMVGGFSLATSKF